ncbi:MAG TPA: DUF2723 domain-containing protein [Dehalococcoidia bacterium]|nr:DUF2723 domain-containing protein [Dehalococcoidia bacterium]
MEDSVVASPQARRLALPALASVNVSWRVLELALGATIFIVAFAVYNATLTPSLSYQSPDGNELATIPYQLGLAHQTGYPMYTWLGKLFTYIPVGDVAHRMNLMSATGAAAGSALLFAIALLVIRGGASARFVSWRGSATPVTSAASTSTEPAQRGLQVAAALFGALLFAFSTTLWSQAVIAEVYAPNIFMVSLTYVLLLLWARREEASASKTADGKSLALFGAFTLVFGMSLGTHLSNLSLAFGFLPFIALTNWRVVLQPKLIGVGALLFGLGLLQYLWLPYKAGDAPTLGFAEPNSLDGILRYTYHAFDQLKWAYPLSAVPDRIDLYLDLLRSNFYIAGMLVALLGAWLVVFRHPKAFFLFVPGYIAQMAFFLEYRATDLDVFFVTTHFIVAVFAAYGFYGLLSWGYEATRRLGLFGATPEPATDPRRRYATIGVAVALAGAIAVSAAMPAYSLASNWGHNDQSQNTGINDFYRNVFASLPANATLNGQGGVFGYDMFYYRYVYDWRPDVRIPATEQGARPGGPQGGPGGLGQQAGGFGANNGATTAASGAQYSVNSGGFGGGRVGVGGGFNQGAFGNTSTSWSIPVIASPVLSDDSAAGFTNRTLTLYETTNTAPTLFVSGVTPQNKVGKDFGGVTLAGYDVDTSNVEAGGTVHLKLYWQGAVTGGYQIYTRLGESKYFERHAIGFGNVARYVQLKGSLQSGSYLVEEYDLVILSSIDKGGQPLQVRVSNGVASPGEWFQIGTLKVSK